MTLISFLLFLLCFFIGASLAYWVITKFFQPPVQMPLLAIAGVILLIVLIFAFVPDLANYRIWGR